MANKFTDEQINNWMLFEQLRQSGENSIHDEKNGCKISGLTKEEWRFCLSNYVNLKEEYEKNML